MAKLIFKFELEAKVITVSGEHGTVIGRAEYLDCVPQYLLRYVGADGKAVERWWASTVLEPYNG